MSSAAQAGMRAGVSHVVVIVNPISGGRHHGSARRRAETVAAFADRRGLDVEIVLTERPGHAGELADAARRRGADLVIAWGGDGTVNEVASALAQSSTPLAIVPGGSGNGLARELGMPLDPVAALTAAVTGATRLIDAGELDGRLFFNVAGIGIDARIAQRFAAGGHRRGLGRYVTATVRELLTYRSPDYRLVVDGRAWDVRPLVLALANSRQYGGGAVVAPRARLDDGLLDVVVVKERSPLLAATQAWRLFAGSLDQATGVETCQGTSVEISAPGPIACHLDGEPYAGRDHVRVRVRPGLLRVVFTEDLHGAPRGSI